LKVEATNVESAESRDPLERGEILAGKYRVERLIGEGGMGQVFAAEHVQLGHRVALKVLRASALESQEAVQRFLREARAAASLQSDHVARVSDVGTLESGAPYMVMELLEGTDLAQVISEKGTLPIDVAVDYMLQACEALADAHCHGIVHRDLKPANLFLTIKVDGKPFIKVLDFGISKASALILGGSVENITSTAAMIGSPKYMSPEQMQDSRGVDARADLWALGASLFELLTGKRAFDGTTLATTCVQILEKEPPAPRSLREDIPIELEAVILRCLRKDPSERFADVSVLARELAPFAEDAETMVFRISKLLRATSIRAPAQAESLPSVRGVATPSSRTSRTPGPARAAKHGAATSGEPPAVRTSTLPPMGTRGKAIAAVALVALFIVVFAAFRLEKRAPATHVTAIPAAAMTPIAPAVSAASEAPAVPAAPPIAEAASAPIATAASVSASPSASASSASQHASQHASPTASPTASPKAPAVRHSKPAPTAHGKPAKPVSDSVLEDRR
jgi:serine/threonine protein kinase